MSDLPRPPGFDVRVDVRDREVVAYLAGELDISTGPVLRDAVPAMLEPEFASLVLDLSALQFCDSRGLGQMVALHHEAAARGAAFRLVGVTGQVARILGHTGLDQIFEISSEPAPGRADR